MVGRDVVMGGRIAPMKITGIESAVLRIPCPKPMSLEFADHRMVAAFISTDEGLEGFGYTLAFGGGGAEAMQVYLETRLKPLLLGPDPRANRKRVEAVKKALGDGVRLMVDVNQKLDVLGSIRQAQMLEDLDLVWYEEPVLADDYAGCAEVARAIKIPVATGENHYTR